MTKSIIILLILVVVAIVASLFLFLKTDQNDPLERARNNALQNVILDEQGNPVTTFHSDGTIESYLLAIGPYKITMDAEGRFVIILSLTSSSELEALRQQAEKRFLELIGIEQENACNLDVSIRIVAPNSPLGGQIFRLSFCQ